MRKSTRHAIAQRLVALIGFVLFAAPIWFRELDSVPPILPLLGLATLLFGILSGWGVGPWGSHYKDLLLEEHEAYLKSLEPGQPWQQ